MIKTGNEKRIEENVEKTMGQASAIVGIRKNLKAETQKKTTDWLRNFTDRSWIDLGTMCAWNWDSHINHQHDHRLNVCLYILFIRKQQKFSCVNLVV